MAKKNDLQAHWRDSAHTPRFFIVDARAGFAVFIFMLHPRLSTFIFAVIVVAILGLLYRFRITLTAAARLIRGWLTGPNKIIGR